MSDTIITGLAFGDEGKGSTTDAVVRQQSGPVVVVRYNGGAQAAHNVVTKDGRHHTHSQTGSGTLAGASTHLSQYMLFDPLSYVNEFDHLVDIGEKDLIGRVTVDPRALVVTPYHKHMNRAREAARGAEAHGTCGMGVGEAQAYALAWPGQAPRVGDLLKRDACLEKLLLLRQRLTLDAYVCNLDMGDAFERVFKHNIFDAFDKLADPVNFLLKVTADPDQWATGKTLIFEGAQGVLLDEDHGFHPHTTWSKTTPHNARVILKELGRPPAYTLGVVRSYMTRHGAGPLPGEDPTLALQLPETHNHNHGLQGAWRAAPFDEDLVRRAIHFCDGMDGIALTHLDRYNEGKPSSKSLGVPIVLRSYGPAAEDKAWTTCSI